MCIRDRGVHVVTVNDYLAKRDSEWMGKVFNYLGVSTGCISNDLNDFERNLEIMPDKEIIEENHHEGIQESIFSKFKSRLNKIVDNAALKQMDKSKKNIKPKSYPEIDISPSEDKWNTSGLKKINKVVTCNSCHSLNDGETNYCGACGNYLS